MYAILDLLDNCLDGAIRVAHETALITTSIREDLS
jgi:hypothetical protein